MDTAARRARVARQVVVARHMAGKKHRAPKILPRIRHPSLLEAEYARDVIRLVVAPAREALAPLIAELPELLKSAKADRVRLDQERRDHIEERDGKWVVLNEARTKVLGTYATRAEAVTRLQQIEYFKHRDDFDVSEPRDTHGRWMGGDFVEEPELAINHGSLGIPRSEMPQIASKDVPEFLAKLAAKGIATESRPMRVGDLRPTQTEVNVKKAKEMLAMLPEQALAKPVLASKDGYILDGHHRWAALRISDPNAIIHTHTVDLPIHELLAEANAFEKTFRKTVNDRSDALDEPNLARAIYAAARGRARLIRADFNPDEPRDQTGKWSSEGAALAPQIHDDPVIQHAANTAHQIAHEWQRKLAPLGVKVVMGGSLVSGTAIPGAIHDMDVRFLYDGDRDKMVPKIEDITGLRYKKTIQAGGGAEPLTDAHMIEGKITRNGVTLDVEGQLRTPKGYQGWAARYPEVLSREELQAARAKKAEMQPDKKAYKAYKAGLLAEVQKRVAARGDGPDEPRDKDGKWTDIGSDYWGSTGGSHALGKHGIEASETLFAFAKRIAAEKSERVKMLATAFAKSPAVVIKDRTGRETLLIKTPEPSNRDEGSIRVSAFLRDGPLSHVTKSTDDDLHKEIAEDYHPVSARPATDADVMAWTSTKEFEEGSARVAHVQRLNAGGRADAGESSRVRQLLDAARERMRSAVKPTAVESLARRFAENVSTHQRIALARHVKAALGVDVNPGGDKRVAAQMDNFVHRNVHLITTIPERLLGDVEKMVHHAVTTGTLSEDLGDDIKDLTDGVDERIGMSERHARFIARDQTGRLFGDINESRQRSLGVSEFTWRSSEDERVRGDPEGKYPNAKPSHFDLNGETFSWDDPPQPEGADEPITPGKDYQCRCSAEPNLDDVLDEGDDQGDDIVPDEDAIPDDESDFSDDTSGDGFDE